jgi:streptogramin lyase
VESLLTEKDRRLFQFIGSDWNSATLTQQAPRRLSGDKKGNVWVANWWGNNVAKIDSRTHRATYYYYPIPGHFPGIYDTVVDKDGMVWMNLMDTDRVAKFDPNTEKWAEYQLPTLGTETRFVAVDNHKTPVEVWVPYWRTHKLARIQFRTPEQLQGQR